MATSFTAIAPKTSTLAFTSVAKPSAVSQTVTIPPAVKAINTYTPSYGNAVGSATQMYADPAKVSTMAQTAAKMAQQIKPVPVIPLPGGLKGGGGGSAAGLTAAVSPNPGIITGGGGAESPISAAGASGGGGGGSDASPDQPAYDDSQSQPYVDQGPQYDPQTGYSDQTWDDATTQVPASTAVTAASTAQPSAVSVASTAPGVGQTVKPAVTKGILQRFWAFLFGGAETIVPTPTANSTTTTVAAHGEERKTPIGSLEYECGSLVRRARFGDQNATALLCQIRDNSAKGIAKAVVAQKLIMSYIDAHPPGEAQIAGELTVTVKHDDFEMRVEHVPCCPCVKTAVGLAGGETLSNQKIAKYMSQFGGEMQRAMVHGMMNPRALPHDAIHDHLKKAHAVGRSIGAARRLQALQQGGSFTAFDPVIGWEVGE